AAGLYPDLERERPARRRRADRGARRPQDPLPGSCRQDGRRRQRAVASRRPARVPATPAQAVGTGTRRKGMKTILAAVLMLGGVTAANAQTPQPADWTILTLTANTNRPADVTWDRIGGHDWCGILRFLDRLTGCTINSGKGEVGSVRTVMVGTTPTVEMAVARTPLSYTYAQPYTPIFYHG